MSKETINITLDHFKPKAAPGYGWRNNSEEYMKLHFTVEVLDKDGNEIVNKKFKGYGPYPYKHQVEIDMISDELAAFMVEEVRSTMNKALFVRVCKTITKALMRACDDEEIGYWSGEWYELHDQKPIGEIPLKEINISSYPTKYQKQIIKLILKDKSLLEDQEVGKRVIEFDAKAGYNWVESKAITEDEYLEIIDQNTNRVFTKAESKFLSDKGLDKGARMSSMFADEDSFDLKTIAKNPDHLKYINEADIAPFAQRLAEIDRNSDRDDKKEILNLILSTDSWFSTSKNLPPSKEWIEVVEALDNIKLDIDVRNFPCTTGMSELKRYWVGDGYLSKEVLDINSTTVDIFSDVWVAAFKATSRTLDIFYPIIYFDSPINFLIVKKSINVRKLHLSMFRQLDKIEGMGLINEFNNPKFKREIIKNTNPQTLDEKVEFVASVLNPAYWGDDVDFKKTGELDTFYRLIEACKSDEDFVKGLVRRINNSAIYEGLFSTIGLSEQDIDLLSDLYVSLDMKRNDHSLSHECLDYMDMHKGKNWAITCAEKLINNQENYCELSAAQPLFIKHAPHLYEKFLKITPPEPVAYEEFYESGKLKETGIRICKNNEGLKTTWHENGQQESEVSYKNGKEEGLATWWHENGQKKLEFTYKNGKAGVMSGWHDNGQIEKEKIDEIDEHNYTEVEYYEDGSVKSSIVVVNNVSRETMYGLKGNKTFSKGFDRTKRLNVGEVSIWHENGQLWDIKHYNEEGKLEGQRFTYDDQGKQIYSAQYSNGIASNQNGEEKTFDCDLPFYETPPKIKESIVWVDGENNGIKTKYKYHNNGKMRFKGEFVGDDRNGLEIQWYENGQKKAEINFKDGQQEDLTPWWYENGQKDSEINFKNDKKDGLEIQWHENGQKKAEINYKDDVEEGLEVWWYDDGQKQIEVNLKDGRQEGLTTMWYENGQKESKGNFKDGQQEGLVTWWYGDGSKKSKGNYKGGKRHGSITLWDKQGNVTFSGTYDNGESNDQNGLEPQYDDEGNLSHYIEYKDGVVINEKVDK